MIVSLLEEEPSAHGEQDGRRKLTFETTGSAGSRRRVSKIRPRFALFGGFGLAGAAATVAGAVLLSSGTTPRAPDASGVTDASGSRLMLTAAESVEKQPAPQTGRYWAVQEQLGGRLVEEHKEYDFVRQTGQYDAGPKKEDAWITQRMVSKKYVRTTKADGARANVLDSFRWTKSMLAQGSLFQTQMAGTSRPGTAPAQVDLRTLPSDPDALKAALERTLPPEWRGPNETDWLFANAKLILSGPVDPRTRGAVYRLLAEDPNLRNLGTVMDALGRRGTAFALREKSQNPADRGLQVQMIIDTRTGRLLATQTVLTKPGGIWADRKTGDIVDYDAVRSYGWTDQVPNYPMPKTL